MTKEQLEVIVGLFIGVQTALVHLANVLASKSLVPREEISASFRATAEQIPQDVPARPSVVLVLNQIAAGIDDSSAIPVMEKKVRDLLH